MVTINQLTLIILLALNAQKSVKFVIYLIQLSLVLLAMMVIVKEILNAICVLRDILFQMWEKQMLLVQNVQLIVTIVNSSAISLALLAILMVKIQSSHAILVLKDIIIQITK